MNLATASVASAILSLGRMNRLATFKHETIVRISLVQLYLGAVRRTLESCGSRGNYAIIWPSLVSSPSSSKAPK